MGWIGVDLDGTLAEYNGWKGEDHIGEPIPSMVERVKHWLAQGKDVRIFTARVVNGDMQLQYIKDWCVLVFGRALPITNEKDFAMIELWDDRCVQVEPNTGKRVDDVFSDFIHEAAEGAIADAGNPNINHPSHYTQGKYEVIDVIEDWGLDWCLSNTIKYIGRFGFKANPLEDLKKARWYLDRKIRQLEDAENETVDGDRRNKRTGR